MKKSLFWLLALVLSPVAVLVVITPMDSQKQYIFGLLSIGILFLMGFSKRRSVSVIMVVTSLLMSTRYMYFRLTQTLHFNSSIEAILGMGLFLAEVYIWVMLLLSLIHISEPTRLGMISYAVFCLKKKKKKTNVSYTHLTLQLSNSSKHLGQTHMAEDASDLL